MQVAQVVPGFSEALTRMKKGGEYKISIPPQLGYGDRAAGPIPANSTLHFTVTLLDFRSEAEVRAMQQQMQQMQQQQRSEEHTSELQSLMRISYAVFCLKKKNK